MPDHPYPGVTPAHPVYRAAVATWLESACAVAAEHLATRGGCVIDLQLDDEPSYFQLLGAGATTRLLDNPVLLASPGQGKPSRFGAWVLERHGSLDAIDAAYGTVWSRADEIEPPRTELANAAELPRHADWFDFKLHEVNVDMEHQYRAVVGAGIDVPISMLFPYLLSLNAVRFTDFIEERGLGDFDLTDGRSTSRCSARHPRMSGSSATLSRLSRVLHGRVASRPRPSVRDGAAGREFHEHHARRDGAAVRDHCGAEDWKGISIYMMVGGEKMRGSRT